MAINEKAILNTLLSINYDRLEGYIKAVEESRPVDETLVILFNRMANESRDNVFSLTQRIKKMGGKAVSRPSFRGTFYKAWMGVKLAITGKNAESILSACEEAEEMVQEKYNEALENIKIAPETRVYINMQKEILNDHLNEIKILRNNLTA